MVRPLPLYRPRSELTHATAPCEQLKAPAETPYSVLAIAELCAQAGVPPGVVNVVLTSEGTAEAGRELCENPTVRSSCSRRVIRDAQRMV